MSVLPPVLASLALAALAATFVPIDYALRAGADGVRCRVRWGFGLVRFVIRKDARDGRTRDEPPRDDESRADPRNVARVLRRLIAIDGLPVALGRLARGLARALGCRHARVRVRAGAEDPADTGELCGWVGTALVFVPPTAALRPEFTPDFSGAAFAADAEVFGRCVPARVAGALGRFALSRPGRRALGAMLWNRER
jgi:hypothetical protein